MHVGLITDPVGSYGCGVSKSVVQCKIKINNLPLMPYGFRRDKNPSYL